ncbi:LacI family DNA-binding transcriptional regulator [Gaetbulibacter sp. M235]|uniref:substrate-binding domain-containing protein n=1 Tax=Gaetbulibacter sp. M235 TaxID=3126510 RepID=UPI00374E2F17
MKKYTIKDIAELAGVSKGTVDRVIHNRGKVSQKALDKVKKLLEEIDYQPNPMARNLKNNKVYKICVVLPNPEEDSFWEPCINGVNQAIQEFKSFLVDIKLFFYSPNSTKSFQDVNNKVLDLSPDAVLLTPLFYKESILVANNYKSAGIIVSTFNNQIDLEQIVSFVGQDLHQSGRVAARLMHMILPKKSDIIICHIDETFNNAIHMQRKEKGFRDYFEEVGDLEYSILTINVNKENLNKSLNKFLKSKDNVSGIFVTTSKAFNVVEILQESNYKNIKVIGYDLLNENINFLKKNIISFLIHQSPKAQTYLGLTYLIEHFLFNKDIPNQKLLPIDIVNSENLSSYIEN